MAFPMPRAEPVTIAVRGPSEAGVVYLRAHWGDCVKKRGTVVELEAVCHKALARRLMAMIISSLADVSKD